MSAEISVHASTPGDALQIAEIYNHYVRTSTITFEEESVVPEEMARRIAEVQASRLPWLVARCGEQAVGFAYANKWKARAAYRFSVEVTVYVRDGLSRSGIGSRLYSELFAQLRNLGVHAVIGGVALPNEASVRLHETFGFRKVAHFSEVGFKFNRWIDVAYWQLTL